MRFKEKWLEAPLGVRAFIISFLIFILYGILLMSADEMTEAQRQFYETGGVKHLLFMYIVTYLIMRYRNKKK